MKSAATTVLAGEAIRNQPGEIHAAANTSDAGLAFEALRRRASVGRRLKSGATVVRAVLPAGLESGPHLVLHEPIRSRG
jgi:hypothetical protein